MWKQHLVMLPGRRLWRDGWAVVQETATGAKETRRWGAMDPNVQEDHQTQKAADGNRGNKEVGTVPKEADFCNQEVRM